MLLAMDIGNTNVKIGVFDNDKVVASWRMSTKAYRTADEYGMVLYDLLKQRGAKFEDITDAVLSSVAPALNYTIEHMCQYYIGRKPLCVTHTLNTGITLGYDHPSELGADRIVGAAAAYHFYGGPVIEIDFGSATTFNLVTGNGEFIGGAIAPGIMTATESLVTSTAKLPRIELTPPEDVVGTNTRACMQSGIIFGYSGLVKYMVEKYKQLPRMSGAKVIATGGLSEIVAATEPKLFDVVDRALALKGLRFIYDANK